MWLVNSQSQNPKDNYHIKQQTVTTEMAERETVLHFLLEKLTFNGSFFWNSCQLILR